MNLTNVIFTFYDIKGEPIADTPFTIQLIRSGFDKQIGVVVPTLIEVVTDSSGMAMVALAPSSTPYYVQIDGYGSCSKQSYKFYVPEVDHDVPFQELIDTDELDPAVITDEKIKLIIESSILAKNSAVSAKLSETNAKASEVASATSEANAKAAEDAAKLAQTASQNNADSALASKNAAKISETNAKTSETNAKASETAAKASQTAAKTSETIAKTSETNATTAAFNATTEAGKAAASATAAKTSETNAKASETNTSALKDSVEQTAAQVQEIKNDTEALYNQALAIGSGWSPVLKSIMDGSRAILQITDWTGGRGTKPAVGYVGPNGVVATTANALDIRGAKGVDGKSFTVNATGTLAGRSAYNSQAEGFAYLATDNGMLYLRQGAAGNWSPGIPFGKGDKGDQGDTGATGETGPIGPIGPVGPTNKLTIGTVTTGATSSATITGTAPNQILNLTLQKGDKGDKGDTGLGFTQAQYDKLDGIEVGAQKNVATNLGVAYGASQVAVTSSTGTNATIAAASTTQAGVMVAADKVKLNGAAPLASPTFTGIPTGPTAADSSDSGQLATTAFVRAAMKKNGMADVFGSAVDRYVNSTGTSVAPYDNCDTFPVGTRILADRNFVVNCPTGESLWYIETKANYTATAGRWQIAQGYQQGYIWHRWATSSNVYGAWRQLMSTDGSTMTGQLHVLNQAKEDNSQRAASTNFVHAAMQYYGVNQAQIEASSEERLTGAGQGATNDFNLMVGTLSGGTYTIAGSYLNGPNGAAAASYTAVLHVIRRAFNAGPAVTQWFYAQTNGAFMRQGTFTNNVWVWSQWAKVAWETSNVASATKLQTARNITVGNTTKTFDGTADIAFTAADMGIVGQNLLFNSDFTKGMANTSALRGYTRGGSATGLSLAAVDYDPVGKYYSVARKAARIECTASNVNQYVDLTTDTNLPVPALPGQVFTSSVKFRGTPGADFRTYIQFRNDTGAVIQTATSPVVASKDTWQTMELTTAVAPAGTINAHVYIGRLQRNNSSPSAMWLELAEPQFQEGSYATPYAPSTVRSNSGDAGAMFTGDDFNKMIIDGDYLVWATPSSMANAPATTRWGHLNVAHMASRIFQTYTEDGGLYAVYKRRSVDGGTVWSEWSSDVSDLTLSQSSVAVGVNPSRGQAMIIPGANATQAGVLTAAVYQKIDGIETGATKDWTGTPISTNGLDLNNYTTPGAYFCSANAVSATLLNNPTTKAFSLNVYPAAGIVQYLTEYSSGSTNINRIWVRGIYNTVITPWQEIFTSGSLPTGIANLTTVNLDTQVTPCFFAGTQATITCAAGLPIAGSFDCCGYVVGSGADVTQFLMNGATMFKRSNDSPDAPVGNWTPWVKIFHEGDPQTTTTTDAAGTNNTNIASTAFVQAAISGSLSKTVTGGTVTLTEAEVSNMLMVFSGTLTSNVTISVPTNVRRQWVVSNMTTGAFTLTVRAGTSGGGTVVTQGRRTILYCDGTNVNPADSEILDVSQGGTGATAATGSGNVVLQSSPALTGNPTATTQGAGDNSTRVASTAFVQSAITGGLSIALSGTATTLTAAQCQNEYLRFTGAMTANHTVTFPNQVRMWLIRNDTTGNFVLNIKGSAATLLVIPKGERRTILIDSGGTAFFAEDYVTPVSEGGTGTTTSTGSGSVVLSVSPDLTGTPTAPTPATNDNSTKLATTAHVQAVNAAETGAAGYAVRLKTARNFSITGGATAAAVGFDGQGNVVLDVTALDMSKATAGTLPVARGGTGTTTSTGSGSVVLSTSPALGGVPTAPTAATTTNTTQIATTAHVQAVNLAESGAAAYALKLKTAQNFSITGGATAAVKSFDGTGAVVLDVTGLDMSKATAGTLAVARGGTGTTTSTGSGANALATSPALAGTPTAPTAAQTVNNTQLATTAYVKREVYTPNDIIEQRRGAVSTGQWLQTWGWNGKKASFALEMTADEEIQIISVDKETGIGKRYLTRWNQAGAMDVPTYVQGRTENVLWAPAVTQKLNIGGAFSSWANDGGVPVIQVDAPDRNSAYMLWRATRWGYAHLAAMHFHETAGVNQMVSMSLRGGNGVNQFRWYSNGSYECDGSVSANGVILTSDTRLKDLHGGVTGALDKLAKISKVFYSFKGETAKHLGYTAQSVEAVLPEAVTERDAQPHEKQFVGDKVKIVDYNAVAALQAQAIDELHALVKKQQAQIDSLMAALASR